MKKFSALWFFMVIGYFANGQKNNLVLGLDGGANYLISPNFFSSVYLVKAASIDVPTFGPSLGFYLTDEISFKTGFYYTPQTNYKVLSGIAAIEITTDGAKVKSLYAYNFIFPLLVKCDIPLSKAKIFLELGACMNITYATEDNINLLYGDDLGTISFLEQSFGLCAGMGASYTIYKNIGLNTEIIYCDEYRQNHDHNLNKFLHGSLGVTYTIAFAKKSKSK